MTSEIAQRAVLHVRDFLFSRGARPFYIPEIHLVGHIVCKRQLTIRHVDWSGDVEHLPGILDNLSGAILSFRNESPVFADLRIPDGVRGSRAAYGGVSVRYIIGQLSNGLAHRFDVLFG